MYKFKLLIKFGILSGLLFAQVGNCLLRSQIHISGGKFKVSKKLFKAKNSLLKQSNGDFPRIAIIAEGKCLRDPYFFLLRCPGKKVNEVIDRNEIV